MENGSDILDVHCFVPCVRSQWTLTSEKLVKWLDTPNVINQLRDKVFDYKKENSRTIHGSYTLSFFDITQIHAGYEESRLTAQTVYISFIGNDYE